MIAREVCCSSTRCSSSCSAASLAALLAAGTSCSPCSVCHSHTVAPGSPLLLLSYTSGASRSIPLTHSEVCHSSVVHASCTVQEWRRRRIVRQRNAAQHHGATLPHAHSPSLPSMSCFVGNIRSRPSGAGSKMRGRAPPLSALSLFLHSLHYCACIWNDAHACIGPRRKTGVLLADVALPMCLSLLVRVFAGLEVCMTWMACCYELTRLVFPMRLVCFSHPGPICTSSPIVAFSPLVKLARFPAALA